MLILWLLGAGLVSLLGGAELLVRGASRLALAAGVRPLVVGLTVVAFGTSAPELAVSVRASLAGDGSVGIALGNVIGSNIANVLLILGLSALVAPLVVERRLVRLDVPVMVGCSVLVLLLAADGEIGRREGVALFVGVIAYTALLFLLSRREPKAAGSGVASPEASRPRLGRDLSMTIGGLVLLIVGGQWLVTGAVEIATRLGVSELLLGLTVVAIGTSLPELATSAVAAFRGERDIAVGNVIGSNVFNLLCVLGSSAAVGGGVAVEANALRFDLPVMVVVSVLCLPILFSGYRVSRAEGLLFIVLYSGYLGFLVLRASGHPEIEEFRRLALFVVLPLVSLVVLAQAAVQVWQGGARAEEREGQP